MSQFWTIAFVVIVVAAFAVAHWHDCDDARRRVYGAQDCGEGEEDAEVSETVDEEKSVEESKSVEEAKTVEGGARLVNR